MKKLLTIPLFLISFFALSKIQFPLPKDDQIYVELSKGNLSELDPKNISLLVWNLHKGQDEDFKKDFEFLAKDKDLLLLQEVYLDKNMLDVFDLFDGYGFKTATSFFDPLKKLTRTGVAIASPVEPVDVKFIKTLNLEPIINTPKMSMINRYRMKGTNKLLTVATIHSINIVTPDVFNQEIKRVFDELKKYPKPIIFAGDFNTWLGEKIFFLDEQRKALGLKEAIFTPDNRMNKNDYYLDHFFYSSDLVVKDAKCIGTYMGSDHKPMELELEYIGSDK